MFDADNGGEYFVLAIAIAEPVSSIALSGNVNSAT